MGFVPIRACVVLKVMVVLLNFFIAFGNDLDTVSWTQAPHHAPIYPPVGAPHHHKGHSPSKAPVHPPSQSPAKPPTHSRTYPVPVRKLVAVQGVVYCKACKYTGVDTLLGATPILGAVVKLQCNNTKYTINQPAKTDKNGYFFIMAPKTISTFGSHKCKVFIVSSSLTTCTKPTNLHYGVEGAILLPTKSAVPPPPKPLPFQLFTVGPFAFEPSSKVSCPR